MKVRHGFVSNSSSSSFIIGIKANVGVDVKQLLTNIFSSLDDNESGLNWCDVDKQIETLKLEYKKWPEPYIKELIETLEKEKDDYVGMMDVSISRNSDVLCNMLQEFETGGLIDIVREDG
jgi:hypothetical protein